MSGKPVFFTGDIEQELGVPMTDLEVEFNLRMMLANNLISPVCNASGPTRFELTHFGKRELEDAWHA